MTVPGDKSAAGSPGVACVFVGNAKTIAIAIIATSAASTFRKFSFCEFTSWVIAVCRILYRAREFPEKKNIRQGCRLRKSLLDTGRSGSEESAVWRESVTFNEITRN